MLTSLPLRSSVRLRRAVVTCPVAREEVSERTICLNLRYCIHFLLEIHERSFLFEKEETSYALSAQDARPEGVENLVSARRAKNAACA